MLTRNRAPTHPGTILKVLYLDPRKVSVTAFSDATGISRKHLSQIINGHVGITSETAVRISAVLDTSAQMWMNGQTAFDLWHAQRDLPEGKPVRVGAFAPEQGGGAEAHA
ncbi:HigA family addiction module antitoxin [Magnetospirillum molischianum]|uniref:Plasmid maintenance system antidote protein n=1 Tax=Magnetospirillum molischianum DSM 120 TaxID=1150626 RepID=H8FNJ0_MAGML|nr:HigA family addiction module antitoxin [Magnetospirillum molischianum]CCG39916.1 Plasmid maintenance system antidote protein [Magnetospirillum molischianum DSM 120]CCG39922.1 Plasmid maintenance system antidote protein [Magnetospirillum molischianum DSM 120]CCG39928.1 Plasmid maintenance system antidote protein [Magnetospirillum molischianum DSM 120]